MFKWRYFVLKYQYFVLFIIISLISVVNFYFFEPAEDAVILFNFAENFANTGIISYYPYGEPAEGSTDFLFFLLIAFLYKLGFSSFFASQVLSNFGILLILYYFSKIYKFYYKKNIQTLTFYSFFLILILHPFYKASLDGFSVYFFGGFIFSFIYYYFLKDSKKLAFIGFLVCLIRPDGIILVFPLSLIYLFENYNRSLFIQKMKIFLYYAIIPSMIYFMWRWWYFEELLPLPFLVKSDTGKNSIFLFESFNNIINTLYLCLPLFFLAIFEFKKINFKKINFAIILSITTSVLFYCTMRLEQNIGGRFFIGIQILTFVFFLNLPRLKFEMGLFAIICCFLYSPFNYIKNSLGSRNLENTKNVGQDLQKMTFKGKILTTEAGYITYYSRWESRDSWGLSTAEYAKNLIQPSDIKKYQPDLIVANAVSSNYFSYETSNCLNNSRLKLATTAIKRNSHDDSYGWSNQINNIMIAVYYENYTTYIVPRLIAKPGIAHIILNRKFNETTVSHLNYFVNKKSKRYEEIKKVLEKNGGKSLCQFLKS